MIPDQKLLQRLMADIANIPISNEPPHIQYRDVDEMTINWHLAHLISMNLLKGKILGPSHAPNAVAILGITSDGYEFLGENQKGTEPAAVINISHSTVTVGDKNRVRSASSQNSKHQSVTEHNGIIKKILVGVIISVLGGLIVWYLTHL
jgi:hypothetical protein